MVKQQNSITKSWDGGHRYVQIPRTAKFTFILVLFSEACRKGCFCKFISTVKQSKGVRMNWYTAPGLPGLNLSCSLRIFKVQLSSKRRLR
jgi:hypothetical protein